MSNNFRWHNVEQFISLVNLLSLRNGGQLGSNAAEKEDEEIHMTNSAMGGDDGSNADAGGEDGLKRHFLDRFAEVMSRDKGGKHVSCVALRESGDRHSEEDVRVTLLVARNEAFGDHDQKFFNTVEKLLSIIGASVFTKTKGTSTYASQLGSIEHYSCIRSRQCQESSLGGTTLLQWAPS